MKTSVFRCPRTFVALHLSSQKTLPPLTPYFLPTRLHVSCLSCVSPDTFRLPSLSHGGGEAERLVLACHLSSPLTLALITASLLANAASLARRSVCSRHKRRREFAPGNMSSSHYGIRKSVWCDRQFTPAAKRSFCFSLSLSLVAPSLLSSGSGKHFPEARVQAPKQKSQEGVLLQDRCT